MFSFILKFLFLQFGNGRRSAVWLIFSEIFSLVLTIYIFSMSNKLVDRSLVANEATSYFHFLLIGELALILPVSLLENVIRNFLDFFQSHFTATLEGNQINAFRLILSKSITELALPILRVFLMFIFSTIIFKVPLALDAILLFSIVQLMGMIAMAVMGYLTIYFYRSFQRGLKLIYTFNSLLVVMGGAYFPVSFLPVFIRDYLVWLFPQSIILQLSRMAFHQSRNQYLVHSVYFLIYVGVTSLFIMKFVEMLEVRRKKRLLSYVSFS